MRDMKVNTKPSEKQIMAGNYKKGHIKIEGMDITIENPAGSTRSGVGPSGKKWSTKMNHHYGDFSRTDGADGDSVDCFINPGRSKSPIAYVINQKNKDGSFDEHKVMLCFDSMKDAKKAYLSNYDKGWTGMGAVIPMPIESFKKWVYKGKKSKRVKRKDIMKKEAFLQEAYIDSFNSEISKHAGLISRAKNFFKREIPDAASEAKAVKGAERVLKGKPVSDEGKAFYDKIKKGKKSSFNKGIVLGTAGTAGSVYAYNKLKPQPKYY